MEETILKIKKSDVKNKKYKAIVKNILTDETREINFGDSRYEQYKDRTPLKIYKHLNHNDKKRRDNYFNRFSGTTDKLDAINNEISKSNGLFTAKILSHIFLW